jgi:uncharacterized membrane protein
LSNDHNVSNGGRITSIVSGAVLTTSAINKVTRHPIGSLLRLIAGGYLLYRGISGNCPVSAYVGSKQGEKHLPAINVHAELVVDKSRKEVYSFWRKLENLPHFMRHLASVYEHDGYHSHWVAKGPGGNGRLTWAAEVIKDEPGTLIHWRSAPGEEIITAGKVSFADTVDGGTALNMFITYRPPAGYTGRSLAWLFNSTFQTMVEKDLLRFKQYVEAGEITA